MQRRPGFPARLPGAGTAPPRPAPLASAARAPVAAAPSGVGLDSAAVRARMVQKLAAGGIASAPVLQAMGAVERHRDEIERVLLALVRAGLVDDRRFAEGFAAQARRRGASARKIESKLRARGVDARLVAHSLDEAASEGLDELGAARAYVRKRRLLERDLRDPKERQRTLASLGRQGFSLDVARRALELD